MHLNVEFNLLIKFSTKSFLLLLVLLFSSSIVILAQRLTFTTKSVKFTNNSDTLVGNLLMPKNPFAALVIVHGSGQEKRMIELATQLAKKGLAVLTYDKRGVGESEK